MNNDESSAIFSNIKQKILRIYEKLEYLGSKTKMSLKEIHQKYFMVYKKCTNFKLIHNKENIKFDEDIKL